MPTSAHLFAVDVTQLDYIRLATYDSIAYVQLSALMERQYHDWKSRKWQQYSGRKTNENIFHGTGNQAGRAHYIVSASGGATPEFYRWFRGRVETITSAFYCTRLDVQRTQLAPTKEYRLVAYKRLGGAKHLHQSNSGTTLYINARTSDTYWRIYDKTKTLLRLEVELKGKQAKRAWLALGGGESIDGVWNRFLLRSKVPQVYAEYFRANGAKATLPAAEDKDPGMQRKLDWLKTLDGLVYKLAHDHDTAEQTATLINRWTKYVQ